MMLEPHCAVCTVNEQTHPCSPGSPFANNFITNLYAPFQFPKEDSSYELPLNTKPELMISNTLLDQRAECKVDHETESNSITVVVGQPPNDQVLESGKEGEKKLTMPISYDNVSESTEPPTSSRPIIEPLKRHECNTSAQSDFTDHAKIPLDHISYKNPVIDNSVVPSELDVHKVDPDPDIATIKEPISQENGVEITHSDHQRIDINADENSQILSNDMLELGDGKLECDNELSSTD